MAGIFLRERPEAAGLRASPFESIESDPTGANQYATILNETIGGETMLQHPPEIQVDAARLYPRRSTAEIFGIDIRAVDALHAAGKLRAVEVGNRKLTPGVAILELLAGVAK